MGSMEPAWASLGTPRSELVLDNTLPTGQSFRWCLTAPGTYTGVIGRRVVQLRQAQDDVEWRVLARGAGAAAAGDEAVLREYFVLGTSLEQLSAQWAARDERFRAVSGAIPGARMLRQDPVECLFSFICSSNNHISRIHGMVERLCSAYGSELLPARDGSGLGAWPLGAPRQAGGEPHGGIEGSPAAVGPSATPRTAPRRGRAPSGSPESISTPLSAGSPARRPAAGSAPPEVPLPLALPQQQADDEQHQQPHRQRLEAEAGPPLPPLPPFYSFPTLEQLAAASEESLRGAGFGYRARFITGSVQQLLGKPGGGAAWLEALRGAPYAAAAEALCELPGVGPKVASCVCLFSLDKHQAVPVDTHVHALATRHYAPYLKGKALTKQLHAAVQLVFEERFGPYAGWAHNSLFISELASHKHLLPPGLASARSNKRGRRDGDSDGDAGSNSDVGGGGGGGGGAAAAAAAASPQAAAGGGRSTRGRRRRANRRYADGASDFVSSSDSGDGF